MDRNPQREQMAHESMIRTLRLQTVAVWGQERELLKRYGLRSTRALDVGCGTGEFTWRLADEFGPSHVAGVDILPELISHAREKGGQYSRVADKVSFSVGDAFDLSFEESTFDFVACRHVLQSVPDPEDVLRELVRVTKPGGYLHFVAEDYAMIHAHPVPIDADLFWHQGPIKFGAATGTDLRIGRKLPSLLASIGVVDISVDYLVVDTQRVDRHVFSGIIEAWRDGYAPALVAHSDLSNAEVLGAFQGIIDCILSDEGYAVWHLPVIAGRKADA